MKLLFEGVDITSQVNINKADATDCSGMQADSLDIVFEDTSKAWSEWGPQKGNTIRIVDQDYDTGVMFIDEIIQSQGLYALKALSTPLSVKVKKSQRWQEIRFGKVANDIAIRNGLKLSTYEISDYLYDSISQMNENDLDFLNRICIREGYSLKISNQNLIIYDERIREKVSPTEYNWFELESPLFEKQSCGVYKACLVKYLTLSGEYIKCLTADQTILAGGVLEKNICVSSAAEAERWAKGFLWHANKYETLGSFSLPFQPGLSAASVISVPQITPSKFFISRIRHDFINQKSYLNVRGCK